MSKASVRVLLTLLLCSSIEWACSSDTPDAPITGHQTPVPIPVGGPITVSSSHPGIVTWLSGSAAPGVVWLAAPPGSLPGGFYVTVRGRKGGPTAQAYIQDGGFDATPFPAATGDTLFADVNICVSSCSDATYALIIPATSHPTVLRTFPSLHARDIELNAKVVAVFSEPIAVGSLSASGVQLSMNGAVVAARLAFADSLHLSTVLTPNAPLSPSTSYAIGFTDALQNADGQSLVTRPSVDFTAGTSSVALTGEIAFSSLAVNRTLQIFLMNADGTNVRQLTTGATDAYSEPAWSPDGKKIAFTKARVVNNQLDVRVGVMNADGSGEIELTTGASQPTWSPDGRQIAFTRLAGTHTSSEGFVWPSSLIGVMNADGSGVAWLTSGSPLLVSDGAPAWSPDGARIAFTRDSLIDRANDTWMRSIDLVSPNGPASLRVPFATDVGCFLDTPSWMADGVSLLFWDSCVPGSIIVGDVNGGALRPFSSNVPASFVSLPRMSPDGNWIAVNQYTAVNPSTAWPMYVMRADGSAPRRIGFGNGMAWRPRE